MLRTNLSQEYDCPHGSDSDINEPNLVHHGQKFYCHWCGGEHTAGVDVQVSTVRDWRDYPALPQSAEELQALINEDETPKITDQELQALRKKVATYEARDALGLVPQPPGALGPDGKEWAKTAAGYAHVEAMRPRADGLQSVGPYWYGWALRGAFVAGAEWQEARQHPAQQATHPDDAAVDRFAAAMKAKLASARAKGRSGWDSPDLCSSEKLARMLVRRGVAGGDVVDVANFAMMLHQRAAQGIETTPDHSRAPMKTALNEYVEADGYWNGWFARLDLLRREVLLAIEEMGCCNYNSAAERLRHAHDESGAQLPTLMGLDAAKAKGGA